MCGFVICQFIGWWGGFPAPVFVRLLACAVVWVAPGSPRFEFVLVTITEQEVFKNTSVPVEQRRSPGRHERRQLRRTQQKKPLFGTH